MTKPELTTSPAPLWCALVPLALTLAFNAIIFATGWNDNNPDYERLSYMPPGWVVGLIWCVIYPLWGLAYGEAARRKSAAAYWVVALIVWGWLYPAITPFWTTGQGAVANVFSLLLAVVAASQVAQVSRKGLLLMVPSLLWLCFASWLGYQAWRQAGG